MAAAARKGDPYDCPLCDPGPKPHVGGTIQAGVGSVLIGGKPAATAGCLCRCQGAAPDAVAAGCPTVLIGGRPAARAGDMTAHGGVIRQGGGCRTVKVGA
jgi:uncharacterized Zn-binding protein involved in type VI secretion